MSQIFFSYAHLDKDFCFKLSNKLRNDGLQLWMDDGLVEHTGHSWQQEISDGVYNSNAMIVILSPNYVVSPYCRMEISRATDLGRIIYPVLLEDVPVEHMPLGVSGVQYVDFRKWQDPEFFHQQIILFLRRLHKDSEIEFSTPPSSEQQYLYGLLERLTVNSKILDFMDNVENSSDGEALSGRPNPFAQNFAPTTFSFQDEMGKSDEKVYTTNNINKILDEHPRLMILGNAGAGKTSTLYTMTFDAVRRKFSNPRAPLPLLIDLSQWGQVEEKVRNVSTGMIENVYRIPSLKEFIESQIWLTSQNTTDSVLLENGKLMELARSGEVIFFLDGLNELEQSEEQDVSRLDALKEFLYPDDKSLQPKNVYITCRFDEYQQQLNLLLPSIVIQPLDMDSIEVFTRQHLKDRADDFLAQVLPSNSQHDTSTLYNLVKIPFLLGSMIYYYIRFPDDPLPQTEAGVFQQLVQILWQNYEAQRISRGENMSYSELEQRLSRLAYKMIIDNKGSTVSQNYAWTQLLDVSGWQRTREVAIRFFKRLRKEETEDIGESVILLASEARLTLLSSNNISFSHDLLRDYFAAIQLVKHTSQLESFGMSSISENGRVPANSRLEDILTLAFDLKNGNHPNLVKYIVENDPFLAAEIIEKYGGLDRSTQASLITYFMTIIKKGSKYEQKAAGSAILKLGLDTINAVIYETEETNEDLEKRLDAIELLGYVDHTIVHKQLNKIAKHGTLRDKSLEDAEKKMREYAEKINYMETEEFIQKSLKDKRSRDKFIAGLIVLGVTIVKLALQSKVDAQKPMGDNLKTVGKELVSPSDTAGMTANNSLMRSINLDIEKLDYKRKEVEKIVQKRREEIDQKTAKIRTAAINALTNLSKIR